MLDLETTSSRGEAAIVSLAAYRFEPYGTEGDEPDQDRLFYRLVSLEDQTPERGFAWSPSTMAWWMEQDDEVRRAFTTVEAQRRPLVNVLERFSEFVHRGGQPYVWSHATFDPPVLAHAAQAVGRRLPYPFRNNRDLRTLMDLTLTSYEDVGDKGLGHAHDARWDAFFQAKVAQRAFAKIAAKGGLA